MKAAGCRFEIFNIFKTPVKTTDSYYCCFPKTETLISNKMLTTVQKKTKK